MVCGNTLFHQNYNFIFIQSINSPPQAFHSTLRIDTKELYNTGSTSKTPLATSTEPQTARVDIMPYEQHFQDSTLHNTDPRAHTHRQHIRMP